MLRVITPVRRDIVGFFAPSWSPDGRRQKLPIVTIVYPGRVYGERAPSSLDPFASVRTPLLLVHGDIDFIPVQQAAEFFTALYRQDKRVQLARYAGEEHTISGRANVLDLWRRFEAWLRETMPAP